MAGMRTWHLEENFNTQERVVTRDVFKYDIVQFWMEIVLHSFLVFLTKEKGLTQSLKPRPHLFWPVLLGG